MPHDLAPIIAQARAELNEDADADHLLDMFGRLLDSDDQRVSAAAEDLLLDWYCDHHEPDV